MGLGPKGWGLGYGEPRSIADSQQGTAAPSASSPGGLRLWRPLTRCRLQAADCPHSKRARPSPLAPRCTKVSEWDHTTVNEPGRVRCENREASAPNSDGAHRAKTKTRSEWSRASPKAWFRGMRRNFVQNCASRFGRAGCLGRVVPGFQAPDSPRPEALFLGRSAGRIIRRDRLGPRPDAHPQAPPNLSRRPPTADFAAKQPTMPPTTTN